ncbi:odorant receptor 46a, isoform B-like [Fopius arisanus]|uniref:Odorant receptor 46a, isoform B-like n=1 Tax=Fopius arisanus TaxID=64838 RepID=A0A9R1T1M8_9HYME|nr:PREDICTED: odorant receptor 46a, isoform B-like [Fopius arisanus]
MLILHCCGQLKLVELSLTQLGINYVKNGQSFQVVLRHIVKKHQSVCQFVKSLEKLFNFPWFVELVGCTLMFCFQGYNVLKLLHADGSGVFQIGFIIFSTFGILIQFLLNCWAGECLISQSSKIGYAFYTSQWYTLRPSDARSLMMMGFQKTRPLTLTTWKFSVLSIRLFLRVMKTSLSYLSVLLVMTDF